jgi:hypothetical protein
MGFQTIHHRNSRYDSNKVKGNLDLPPSDLRNVAIDEQLHAGDKTGLVGSHK